MKILSITDIHGELSFLDRLDELCKSLNIDLITYSGDIVKGERKASEWLKSREEGREPDRNKKEILEETEEEIRMMNEFYRKIGKLGVPVMTIPGNMDAPCDHYFKATFGSTIAFPMINLVHHSFAPLGRDYVVTGFGGEVCDGDAREEFFVQRYPSWEAEYGFTHLRYLDQEKIMLFHTPPVGRGIDLDGGNHKGCTVINEIIKTYNPTFVFCGHAHKSQGKEYVGDSIAVNPGAMKNGYYAVVNTLDHKVEFGNLR